MSADAIGAEHWRKLEAEARSVASTMTDPEPQRIMLFIAEGYKLLAERAELHNTTLSRNWRIKSGAIQ